MLLATLNIKNFPDELYNRLRLQAKRHRRSLAQEVVYRLSQELSEAEPASIRELRGLGKELWEDLDAADHVRGERDSWE